MEDTVTYPKPSVTVDVVLFTRSEQGVRVLLIRRGRQPYEGCWALPGGFLDVVGGPTGQGEPLEDAALRELGEEAFSQLEDSLAAMRTLFEMHEVELTLVGVFAQPGRDPRGRTISVAFAAWVPPEVAEQVRAGDDASEVRWVGLSFVEPGLLAFDHHAIVRLAVERLEVRA